MIVREIRNDLREKGALDKYGNAITIDVDGIVKPIGSLIKAARKRGIRIICAGDAGNADKSLYSGPMVQRYYYRIMDPKTSPTASGVVETTRGWGVIDKLKPEESDIILKKARVDCFIGANLELLLRWNGIKTIVIGGVGVKLGILPTVFYAINLGFFVTAPEDCIRPTAADSHDGAMKFTSSNIHGHLAIVSPSSDVIGAWNA